MTIKKGFKKIMLALLCLALPVCFAGCAQKNIESGGASPSTQNPYTPSQAEQAEGTHNSTLTETGKKLVENGTTQYKIIAPQDTDWNSTMAVSEFQNFMEQATGAVFDVANATEYNADDKYIVIGQNAYAESAGVSYDRTTLKKTGVRVTTKGNSVFLGGASSKGTLNAVYEFLRQTVGYEIYAKDVIVLDKSNNVPLYSYDITEVPDFEYNPLGYGSVLTDSVYLARMRSLQSEQVFATVKRNLWHNSLEIVSPQTYGEHTDWYSADGKQLCYTAHGNPDEYAALQEVVFNVIKETVKDKPTIDNIPFTIEDNNSWCTCDACAMSKQTYGTDSAVVVKFFNDLGEKLDEWIKTNDEGVPHDRAVKLTFFAYYATTDAPVNKNADGTYSPKDESVVCRDNVNVLYAPIQAMFNERFDSPSNLQYYETLKGWSACCDTVSLWIYQTNFHNYMYPYNSWDVTQYNYKLFSKFNLMYLFDQGQFDNGRATAFSELKYYLTYRLAWDVNADVAKLTQDYFDNVYGPAAKTMIEMYDAERMYMKHLEKNKGVTGSIYYGIGDAEYFPKYTLDKFLSYTEKALEEIAPLATVDAERYAIYRNHIKIESMFPRFALYNNYSGYYSSELFAELKTAFREDVQALGFTSYRENYDIFSAMNLWN